VDDPLIANPLKDGLALADPIGLGLELTDDYELVDACGQSHPEISLVGSLLKGRFWEATAVPELRVHAARLAARLSSELSYQFARGE
jgi:uncharacterized NAD(P)/FAD-binding protein YdhS